MRSVNKVTLIGNTGDDPAINYTDAGMAIARISLATSSRRKDRDGNQVERTEWHRVVAFGKLAEIIEQYVGKGDPLYIEGELRYNKYTDKEGVERYGIDIVANEVNMLGAKRSDAGDHDDRNYDDRPPQRSQSRQNGGGARNNGNGQHRGNGGRPAPQRQPQYNSAMDDDIPF